LPEQREDRLAIGAILTDAIRHGLGERGLVDDVRLGMCSRSDQQDCEGHREQTPDDSHLKSSS
jgi:hypothetical protein